MKKLFGIINRKFKTWKSETKWWALWEDQSTGLREKEDTKKNGLRDNGLYMMELNIEFLHKIIQN